MDLPQIRDIGSFEAFISQINIEDVGLREGFFECLYILHHLYGYYNKTLYFFKQSNWGKGAAINSSSSDKNLIPKDLTQT